MITDRPTRAPLRPALRRAAEERTYGVMVIDAEDGPLELVICDGRIVTRPGDGNEIDPVAIVAGLLDADEPTCVIEPIRNRPGVHDAASIEINQVVHDAVRRLTARPGSDGAGDARDAAERPSTDPAPAPERTAGDDEGQRKAEADRLRKEFFARRSSPLGNRGGFSMPPATSASTPRSQTLHRPPSSNHLTSTLRAKRPTTPVDAPPARADVPATPEPTPPPDSPPTDSESASERPTRKGALRSLIRSLIE